MSQPSLDVSINLPIKSSFLANATACTTKSIFASADEDLESATLESASFSFCSVFCSSLTSSKREDLLSISASTLLNFLEIPFLRILEHQNYLILFNSDFNFCNSEVET